MFPKRLFSLFILLTFVVISGPFSAAQGVDMVLWVNSWPQSGIDAIQAAADMFAERHPDVNSVTVQAVSQSEHMERLTISVIGGAAPDVVTLAAPFAQPALAGLLQPVSRYIDQSTLINRDDYSPFILDSLSYEGIEYGVPAVEVGLGHLLVYSKDLFSEAGLADRGPDTLDELVDMHQTLTRLHPSGDHLEQVGIHPIDSMGGFYFPLIWGTVFDVDWYDESAQRLNLTAFEESIEYLQRIYDTPGYDLIAGAGIGGWTGGLASGRLAMQVNGYWVPGELKTFEGVGEFGYTWVPSATGELRTASSPWGMGIPVNAPNPDLSFELIEFFTTVEAQQPIFDAVGWLNGNLTAIRQLDISDSPEIAPIISMFGEADQLHAPPPLPILTDIYNTMSGRAVSVFQGEQNVRVMLETLQNEMQIRLDEALTGAY